MAHFFQVAADSMKSPSNHPAPTVLYTSIGNKFEFARSSAMLDVRTIGPFAEPNSARKQPKLRDNTGRIRVNETFLGLGLNRATAVIRCMYDLRGQQQDTNAFHFGVSSKAFSSSQISRGQKMVARMRMTPEEERALAGGLPALISYFETIQQTPDLDSILRRVLSMPSFWALAKSLVKHGGVSPRIAIASPEDRVGPLSLSQWDLPFPSQPYSLPVEVSQ
jgi:hypothetical protein